MIYDIKNEFFTHTWICCNVIAKCMAGGEYITI